MSKKVTKKGNEPSEMEQARYINPLTDFGFKRIFGTEANKDLLIHFLESVLNIDGGIKELHYDNTEKQGRAEIDRKAVFDLHCTNGKGERIIIEMQNLRQKYFKDRALYYASFPIQEQGEKGKDWNFELRPVYSVNIVNYRFGNKTSAGKYASFVQLLDRDTCTVFCDKLMFVFLELPRFTKKEHELQNNSDRWMYVLKHLAKLNDLPEALRNRVFEKLFRVAEILKLMPNERKDYDQSLKNYRDMYLIETELKNEFKKKLEKKDALIRKQSSALYNSVRILLEAGISVQKIADSTGFGIAEIERIKAQI